MISVHPDYDCLEFDEVDSTSSQARRLTENGSLDRPTWIYAEVQTAGRGRQGRTWSSPKGNLMCSLAMRSGKPSTALAQISFVAALAVRDAITRTSPALDPKLKWPNDVLIDGAKVSGILLESFPGPAPAETCLVIGIGINLKNHPSDTPYPATDLLEKSGGIVEPAQMLAALSETFHERLSHWQDSGFERVRQDWLAQAWNWQNSIRVQLPKEEISGTFSGLDEHGALLLELPSGEIRTITAGDVFFATG